MSGAENPWAAWLKLDGNKSTSASEQENLLEDFEPEHAFKVPYQMASSRECRVREQQPNL